MTAAFLWGTWAQFGLKAVSRPARAQRNANAQSVSPVAGYRLSLEYTFGAEGNVKSVADLEALFTTTPREVPSVQQKSHVFEAD